MAIFVNGQLKGKVGNLVYRVVNGQSVVQTVPRPPKGGYKRTVENDRFAVTSKAASRLFRQLKDFQLNLPAFGLYNAINGLFVREYDFLKNGGEEKRWELIPGSEALHGEKRPWLDILLEGEPEMEINRSKCKVRIPTLKRGPLRFAKYRQWKEVQELELVYTLLHYDFETESATVVKRWTTGRFAKSNMLPAMELDWDLQEDKAEEISSGLLLGSVGMRLYASESSKAFLNTPDFNPAAVLGIWAWV